MNSLKLEIKTLMIEALDLEGMTPDDIDDKAPLFSTDGVGLDSIDALEVGIILQKHYGLKLAANDPQSREHFRCIESLAAFVESQRKEAAESSKTQTAFTGAAA
ncbi:phosphopantetheine-binding protein [Caballeronia sp. LZ001]|uniref:phosphopantetheine-binding protein n=1 Tax=Caballeronia sp. LZ001 TaxID=3038553 RepID=UPI00286033A2|nr:phosphopantetheine-binding protein [Caballeronia sp. LZ001]MDR5801391.1 phosphopantetheine-binding protein [Caballeronia sp. LZ001]